MYNSIRVLRNHAKELLFTSILTGILLVEVACGAPPPTPTSIPTPTPQTYESRTIKENGYEVIPVNQWKPSVREWTSRYSSGMLLDPYGNNLKLETIIHGYHNGSLREYVTFRESRTSKSYIVTVDLRPNGEGVVADIDTSDEIAKRLRNREAELYSKVLTAIANNQSPTPVVEEITGTENPVVNGYVLRSTLRNASVVYFMDGELYPFIPWYLSLSNGKVEVGVEANIEAATFYYFMEQLGGNVRIPFTEKNLGLAGGEIIAQNPESTKVKVGFEYDGKNVVVVRENNRSLLVQVLENLYYGVQDGSLAAQLQNQISNAPGSVEALTRVRQTDSLYRGRQDTSNSFQELERLLSGASSETPQQRRQREEQQRQQIEQIRKDGEKAGRDADNAYQTFCKQVFPIELPGCRK